MRTVLFALLVLGSVSVSAQTGYPTRQEVSEFLKETDYALRRFEEVTDRVNINRLNASFAVLEALRETLSSARSSTRTGKSIIAEIERSEQLSGRKLVQVYIILGGAVQDAGNLANSITLYSANSTEDMLLATDLNRTVTLGSKVGGKFARVVYLHLEAQERELELCRARTR